MADDILAGFSESDAQRLLRLLDDWEGGKLFNNDSQIRKVHAGQPLWTRLARAKAKITARSGVTPGTGSVDIYLIDEDTGNLAKNDTDDPETVLNLWEDDVEEGDLFLIYYEPLSGSNIICCDYGFVPESISIPSSLPSLPSSIPPTSVVCDVVNCGGGGCGMPYVVYATVSGVVNAGCTDCLQINGIHVLNWVDPHDDPDHLMHGDSDCTWASDPYPQGCGGAGTWRMLLYYSTDGWHFIMGIGANGAEPGTIVGGTLNCNGTTTITIASAMLGGYCSGDVTIEIDAICGGFSPLDCEDCDFWDNTNLCMKLSSTDIPSLNGVTVPVNAATDGSGKRIYYSNGSVHVPDHATVTAPGCGDPSQYCVFDFSIREQDGCGITLDINCPCSSGESHATFTPFNVISCTPLHMVAVCNVTTTSAPSPGVGTVTVTITDYPCT